MMLLLNYFDIRFRYGLFSISFSSVNGSKWSEEMIMIVFGSGSLILSIGGLALLFFLKNLSMAGWKTKLILTWMSFLMVNAFPCGILTGALLYDGFGVAFFWMVNSFIFRGILALIVLTLLVFTNRLWYFLFLKTAYTLSFYNTPEDQKRFFIAVFFRPWILGLLFIIAFSWPFTNLYWPAFIFSLGYLALIIVADPVLPNKPRIKKSDKQIFSRPYHIVLIAVLLVLIWIAGNLKINF
jgi:hypothetical protein